MSAADGALSVVTTERPDSQGAFLIVCEHASNHFPEAFGALGLPEAARRAHIAWDPGALALARRLSEALDATLVSAGVSRLVYDLNRPPHAPGAMAAQSEVYEIPGNAGIGPDERLRRTETIYLPFHRTLHDTVARRLAQGRQTVMVTVHSFTPVYFGQPRAVELGVIHDADPAFAKAVLAEAQARTTLLCRLNEPYSAADGVTHTLRLQATPYGLAHVMLEVRNDLLTDDGAVAGVAAQLVPVLRSALSAITQTQTEKAAS